MFNLFKTLTIMKKKKYSAPELESVRLLDEMPVLCSSGGGGGGKLGGFKASAGSLIMAALLVCVGCEKRSVQPASDNPDPDGKVQMSFQCSGDMGGGLKVAVDTEKGDCVWESGDRITVINDKGETAEFTLTSGAGTNNGVFSGEITPSEGDDYYAVYPASAVISANGDGKVVCSVPQVQRYAVKSVDRVIPFAGRAIGGKINFKPAMGILRIGVKGDRSVTKATLTGGANEAFAGNFSIDCSAAEPTATLESYGKDIVTLNCDTPVELSTETDTYFSFVVPVGSLSKGFTVTLYDTDGETSVISTVRDNTIGVSDMKYINNITASFSKNYLTFTSEADGSTLSLNKTGAPADATLYYSTDGSNWSLYTFGGEFTLNNGEFVKFKGVNAAFSTSNSDYYSFNIQGSVRASGSIMSLVSDDTEDDVIPNEFCFFQLFKNCTGLTTAPEMNATTLTACCYSQMFTGCTQLKKAPALPATNLPDGRLTEDKQTGNTKYNGVYSFMFDGCTSLVYTPELPAKNLGTFAYQGMFRNCTSLVTTQNLDFGDVPDGALGKIAGGTDANGCCASMFQGCTGLRDAPLISYTKAGSYSFTYAFYGCSNITKVVLHNCTATSTNAFIGIFMSCTKLSEISADMTQWTNDYRYWLYGVAAKGTFHCPQALINNTTSRNYNTVPAGWSMVATD